MATEDVGPDHSATVRMQKYSECGKMADRAVLGYLARPAVTGPRTAFPNGTPVDQSVLASRMRARTAVRTHGFTESVIREMTRVATNTGALNLAQGFPDFAAPAALKDAACAAIQADINQYAVTWGTPRLRRALSAKYERDYGMHVDEAAEITVTCGATEAMAAALMAIVNPGDEVLIFE